MVRDDEHLVLVGMMGAGKSTIGRIIAERLHRPLIDSDQAIERRTGRTVRDIFAEDGEPVFRTFETEALIDALAETTPSVIAAGGGMVLRDENRAALRAPKVRTVWLRADPLVLLERVKTGAHRPALDGDPEGTLRTMYRDREALYRDVADVIITVDGRSVGEVVDAVLR